MYARMLTLFLGVMLKYKSVPPRADTNNIGDK